MYISAVLVVGKNGEKREEEADADKPGRARMQRADRTWERMKRNKMK